MSILIGFSIGKTDHILGYLHGVGPPPFRLPDPQEEHRGQVSEEEAQEQLLRQVVVQAKARYHGALRSLENLSNQAMAMAGEVAKNRVKSDG